MYTGGVKMKIVEFIKEYPVTNLKEWDRNPRKNNEASEKLAKIIEQYGFINPIIIDQDGIIRAGHTRLKAAFKAKIKYVPILKVDFENEAAAIAYAIADNKSNEWAEWDFKELKELISELDNFDFDLEMTGFDLDEMGDILTYEPEQKEIIEDEVPEEPEEPISKRGDIWLLGKHRLMCGDSTSDDVDILMDGKKADMIHTDPPYNVDYDKNKNHPRHKIRRIKNDKLNKKEWDIFLEKLYKNFIKYNKGDIYMWGAPGPEGMKMRLKLIEMGAHWSATIIWKKQQLVLSPAKYQRIYEPCFYGWFDKSSFRADRKQVELWEIDRPHNSKLHPTMKPIELCKKAIENSSIIKNIILDLFGGSGSTLIAAEQLNRICYMMELDEKYVDVIVQRYINFKESTDNIYLIRDGKEYSYEEVKIWQNLNIKNG
jgi:DNA modification methylase